MHRKPCEPLQDPPSTAMPPWEMGSLRVCNFSSQNPVFNQLCSYYAQILQHCWISAAPFVIPVLADEQRGNWMALQRGVGRWLPVCCFRSEAANNEQWQRADSLLLSHSMWCMNGAKGMDMALGQGILVSCLFCPAHSRSQSIHGDIPLLHLVASPPSRAICLLTIARTLNRHQGREQCANVPLTPSSKQTAAQHRFHCTSGSAPRASEARIDQRGVPAGPWAWA